LAAAGLAFAAALAFESVTLPADVHTWLALAALGLGPVGPAFLLWDIGMKRGNVALLGVLSYASPILSTLLLIALGLAEATAELPVAAALRGRAALIATRP